MTLTLKTIRVLFVFILFFIKGMLTFAQDLALPFQNFNVRDGLSSTMSYYVAEDKFGYIWISGINGLDRFDGNEFTHFEHNDSKPFSLPADKCFVVNDKKGDIWVYSTKGLAKYDDKNNYFKSIPLKNANKVTQSVNTAVADLNNHIWFTTEDGWLWEMNGDVPRKKHQFKNSSINNIFCDASNRIWLAKDGALIKYENNTATYYRDTISRNTGANMFYFFFQDSKGRLWCGTWGDGIKLFNPETGTFQTFHFNTNGKQMPRNFTTSIIQLDKNRDELWISSIDPDLGISVFNPETAQFSYLNHNDNISSSLSSNAGIFLFRDSRGIVWYSGESGIDKFDGRYIRFPSINLDRVAGFEKSLPINALWGNVNNIWIGSWGIGVNVYNIKQNKNIKHIDLQQLHPTKSELANVVNSFYHFGINKLVSCTTDGIFLTDITTYKTQFAGLLGMDVKDIIQDDVNRFFIATNQGIYITEANRFDKIKDTIINGTTVSKLYKQGKSIWFYANGVIWKYKAEKLTRAGVNVKDLEKLSGSRVNDISGNGADELYLATSSGLFVFNTVSKSLNQYTKTNGLQHNLCSSVLCDRNGQVWILNEKGLSLFDKNTKTFSNFSTESGIEAPTFEGTRMMENNEGDIYFGRYISLYHFSPKEITIPKLKFAAHIISLQINDSLIPGNYFLYNKEYIPIKEGNRMTIRFGTINFSSEKNLEFEYRLSEKDTKWISLDKSTSITLTGMEPGNYTFQARVKNSADFNAKDIATLNFKVIPPFWRTTWFSILMLFLIITLISLIIQWRINNIKNKANIRHILAEAKIKALRAQMKPHFIFNCLNTIEAFVLQNKQQEASLLIQRFSKLSRSVLEHSRLNNITVDEDMKTLKLYLEIEQTRRKNQFQFKINIDEAVRFLNIPSMIIQPFVENAVLHGIRQKKEHGFISISVQSEGKNIKFVVEDNGIGRKQAMTIKRKSPNTHQSLGMEVTLERLEAIYNHKRQDEYIKFTDWNEPNKTGTKVEIYIPKNYHYAESNFSG